jgi:integrase
MAKRPQFDPIQTTSGWMVSVPASMSASGKRSRKYFPKESAANSFAASLRRQYHQGERGGVIPHALALDAAAAIAILEPLGLSLIEAAKIVQAQWQARGKVETFRERWLEYRKQNENHWRQAYILQIEKMDRWLGNGFMESEVQGITDETITQALTAKGAKTPATIALRMRMVKAVLSGKSKKRKRKAVEIMTVSQCAAMLRACQNKRERWAVALLLFAGIRPFVDDGEITRLDWSDVGEAQIYISGDVSKTGTDRHIPITPRLARLLRGHPTEGKVTPNRWKLAYQRLRTAADIAGKQDITRHTFASNYLAAFGEDATKAAMGHSKGSDTLFRHYRRSVTKEAGERYFSAKTRRSGSSDRLAGCSPEDDGCPP